VWDQRPEPRLLKTESAGADSSESKPAVAATPITDYAYSDEDKKLKIYIKLENVGELKDENLDLEFTRTSFCLTVMNYNNGTHKLVFKQLFDEVRAGRRARAKEG